MTMLPRTQFVTEEFYEKWIERERHLIYIEACYES
jgi:hypothetical protein